MMPLLIAEHAEKLWDTWNIRVLIILSLLVQSFLILSAQLRKRRGGKWFIKIPLWIAYLLADLVATFTIGLMLRAERSDIVAFWAPFLLLHLGGPDTITSFSLEDNELWIRHLLGLILQVSSTMHVILQSLTHNKLWLPTLLILIAGVIKYAERNGAFYLASFDHIGSNWSYISRLPPIPVQFEQVLKSQGWESTKRPSAIILVPAYMVGAIKSLLVGPPMTKKEQKWFSTFMRETDSHKMLRTIEIQLSLLYELLHTKLPVVDSKIGYICRTVNFGCILGALVSFSILLRKYYHNKLGEFDICLTYGLLIGALALDLISIWLLMFSDWIFIRQYHGRENYDEFIKRRSLFETIRRGIQCVSQEDFVEEQAWKLIFTTLREKDIGEAGKEIFGPSRILTGHITNFAWTLDRFEHMDSLLIWHIATEICYRKVCPENSSSSSTSTSNDRFDHRKICKLISDYMFYLLVMEPTTMTATSPNNLKIVFEAKDGPWEWPGYWKKGSKETFIKGLLDKLLEDEAEIVYRNLGLWKKDVDKLEPKEKDRIAGFPRITIAGFLAKELLQYQPGGCPWNLMSRFWIEILCYAAIHCQPIVHARQVSRGGQLLTLVWLLINYLGLTSHPVIPAIF
ncbi:hypothetical protein SLEP1_g58036 [Rubroshorea leprosula]|uniref:DUF4220 domain-containing protein n=1 Tax=Rubroshorea leprosula TaxID=152421 RepID=A0AAV5MQU5_9ROSI|nr:hypothetical protein SLEP1_g58036 [Rubroshorea leprosula]